MPDLLIKKYQKLYFSISNVAMALALLIISFLSFEGYGLDDKLPTKYVFVLMILTIILSLSFIAAAAIEYDGDEKKTPK